MARTAPGRLPSASSVARDANSRSTCATVSNDDDTAGGSPAAESSRPSVVERTPLASRPAAPESHPSKRELTASATFVGGGVIGARRAVAGRGARRGLARTEPRAASESESESESESSNGSSSSGGCRCSSGAKCAATMRADRSSSRRSASDAARSNAASSSPSSRWTGAARAVCVAPEEVESAPWRAAEDDGAPGSVEVKKMGSSPSLESSSSLSASMLGMNCGVGIDAARGRRVSRGPRASRAVGLTDLWGMFEDGETKGRGSRGSAHAPDACPRRAPRGPVGCCRGRWRTRSGRGPRPRPRPLPSRAFVARCVVVGTSWKSDGQTIQKRRSPTTVTTDLITIASTNQRRARRTTATDSNNSRIDPRTRKNL